MNINNFLAQTSNTQLRFLRSHRVRMAASRQPIFPQRRLVFRVEMSFATTFQPCCVPQSAGWQHGNAGAGWQIGAAAWWDILQRQLCQAVRWPAITCRVQRAPHDGRCRHCTVPSAWLSWSSGQSIQSSENRADEAFGNAAGLDCNQRATAISHMTGSAQDAMGRDSASCAPLGRHKDVPDVGAGFIACRQESGRQGRLVQEIPPSYTMRQIEHLT